MYEVGDRVFLTDEYDRFLNSPLYKGNEVEIIAIDRGDDFLPYCVKTMRGRTHWIDGKGIKKKRKILGIKI